VHTSQLLLTIYPDGKTGRGNGLQTKRSDTVQDKDEDEVDAGDDEEEADILIKSNKIATAKAPRPFAPPTPMKALLTTKISGKVNGNGRGQRQWSEGPTAQPLKRIPTAPEQLEHNPMTVRSLYRHNTISEADK
jgi:hypothetical protein